MSAFESTEHRDFYIAEDEVHTEYKKSLKPLLESIQVLDFTPGAW